MHNAGGQDSLIQVVADLADSRFRIGDGVADIRLGPIPGTAALRGHDQAEPFGQLRDVFARRSEVGLDFFGSFRCRTIRAQPCALP